MNGEMLSTFLKRYVLTFIEKRKGKTWTVQYSHVQTLFMGQVEESQYLRISSNTPHFNCLEMITLQSVTMETSSS